MKKKIERENQNTSKGIDKGIVVGLIVISTVLIVFISMPVLFLMDYAAYEHACESIGMENIEIADTTMCLDSMNNAHYVQIKCKGMYWTARCDAELISIENVGEIREIKG